MKTPAARPARGFLLIELLAALLMTSLAVAALGAGFMQGLYALRRVETGREQFQEPAVFFLKLEEDLRNMVALQDYPFEGRADEIFFPAYLTGIARDGKTETRLVRIHYHRKADGLWREEQELSSAFKTSAPRLRRMIGNIESLSFGFPYEKDEGQHLFETFWVEEPYAGLPRAVRVALKSHEREIVKLVSIPQGHFGAPLEGGAA